MNLKVKKIIIRVYIFLHIVLFPYASPALSSNTEKTIINALPPKWKIVVNEKGKIPWGHHWCNKYEGTFGTKYIVVGVEPTTSNFLGKDGVWKKIIVGKESLEIWVMPGDYDENWLKQLFCFHRPIQPTEVVITSSNRVYAKPSSYSTPDQEKIFNEHLSKSNGVESPESPWNDPSKLSWKTWKEDIKSAFSHEFNN